jgi:hypothetical protein
VGSSSQIFRPSSRTVACGTAVAVVACLCAGGCGGQARPSVETSTSQTTGTVTQTGTTTTGAGVVAAPNRTRPATARRHRVDPCPPRSAAALPQTERVPSANTACFRAVVRALWRGVRKDSERTALYAFFPLPAYEQVKALGDPRGDYIGRLIPDYSVDLHAAHELLGPNPGSARLVGTIVPQGYVHWVPPGACYNRIGYYEVPNSRLLYRLDGQVHSFGIASLISWRGIWYVVHLGAVIRSSFAGIVDNPSDGPGTPTPSLTC